MDRPGRLKTIRSCFRSVRDKKGECRWERDNTPIAAYPGKYEWAGDSEAGDCSLRILAAKYEYIPVG